MLYRLAYLSRNELDSDWETMRPALEQILLAARRNNARNGVTGALMFNQRCFAQVLEGRLEDVEETFERIQCDMRHSRVTVVELGPVAERAFGDWSMAYVGESEAARAAFDHMTASWSASEDAPPLGAVVELLKAHLAEAEGEVAA